MDATYFYKQGQEPLYDDLLWSRPQNRAQAGKLLIIGGNLHGFAAPANAYQQAVRAGVGSARIILPDGLRKTVGRMLENVEFSPSTPSGSFARLALADWLENAAWADAVLLAGDLGRNSETASSIESFCAKYRGLLTVTKDAVDYFYADPTSLLGRPNTCLVVSLAQLQKLASRAKWLQPLTFSMNQSQLAKWLHEFTQENKASLVCYHNEQIFVAVNGQVSTTKVSDQPVWRVAIAAHAAVWWLQNPSKVFEGLTTAVHATYQ